MSHREVVPLFLALLAVLAQAAVVAAAVLALVSRRALRSVRSALAGTGAPFALVVAVIATSGSLYFSEIAHFVPCTLCWWQRGFMYPLVPLLAAGLLFRLRWVRPVALVMAAAGAAVAAYHVVIERWPSMEVTSCSTTGLCQVRWVDELGYVTIPVMSLSAFLLVLTLLVVDPRRP
jgi:disulfide bond formation protein DsbB